MPKHFYIGAKGVVRVGDACLVLKKETDSSTYWDIPGGRIDADETLEEALHREIREELPTIGEYEVGEIVSEYRLSKDLPDGLGLLLIFRKLITQPFDVQLTQSTLTIDGLRKKPFLNF